MYIFLETYVPWDVVDFGGKGCKLVQDLVHVLTMLVKHLLRAVVGVALDRNSSKVTRQQNNVHPIKYRTTACTFHFRMANSNSIASFVGPSVRFFTN